MNTGFNKSRHYYETLRSSDLFKNISHDALNKLLEISTSEHLPKHSCKINEDSTLYKFYIIISGKVKIYNVDSNNNRQITLFLLKEKDVFDTIALLDGYNHHIYCETLEPTEVLGIPVFKMRQWMKENPEINTALLRYFVKKMRQLETYAVDVTLESISTRLAKLLIKHMNPSSNKIEFINDLSHDELAGLIGTTRAVLNRHIQRFKAKGILKFSRKHIEITNLQRLKNQINNPAWAINKTKKTESKSIDN